MLGEHLAVTSFRSNSTASAGMEDGQPQVRRYGPKPPGGHMSFPGLVRISRPPPHDLGFGMSRHEALLVAIPSMFRHRDNFNGERRRLKHNRQLRERR